MITKVQSLEPERLGKEGGSRSDAKISLMGRNKIDFTGRLEADGDESKGINC